MTSTLASILILAFVQVIVPAESITSKLLKEFAVYWAVFNDF